MTRLLGKLQRSLSTRLLLIFILTAFLLAALVITTVFRGFGAQWRSNLRPHVEQYLSYVNADLGYPPDESRATELANQLPINIFIKGPDTDYSSNGKTLALDSIEFHRRGYKRHKATKGDISFSDSEESTLLMNVVGDYRVIYELRHRDRHRDRNHFIPLFLLIPTLLLATLFWVIRRMLRPVQDIKQSVEKMGRGELSTRVPVRSNNDLGALAGSINTMASDIESMLDAKRQLLLGASHELRTPLTRARVALQMLPESPYRESIEADVEEMENLITGLLESERVKSGHAALNREAVDLASLIQHTVNEMKADELVLSLQADLPSCQLDPVRMELLLRNLIGNALSHGNNPDQPPQLHAQTDGSEITLSVRDFGAGIKQEHVQQITEPFYRTDASRSRDSGGFGLGLYLVKLITEAHGGSMTIDSSTQSGASGTTMLIKLPI